MNIKLADRLVELRKENKLSQEALAEKLGLSRQSISKWERAEASPDTDNLIALADLYKMSLDELLGNETVKAESIKEIPQEKTLSKKQQKGKKMLLVSPILLIISIAVYVGIGLLSDSFWWIIMWLLFPLVLSFTLCGLSLYFEHKRVLKILFGTLSTIFLTASIYVFLGIEFGLWHIAWLIFLVIPVYIYLSVIKK